MAHRPPVRTAERFRRIAACVAAAVAGVGLSTVVGSPAVGVNAEGYVRLAHLSPDTPAVDAYLSKVGDSSFERQRFRGVAYGEVSDYVTLPVGTYAVSMRPASAPESDPPVLATQVTVEDGAAYTVAGVGRNANLGLTVLTDDLSRPAANKVKVRIIQASIAAPVVDVTFADGRPIATQVQFATATPYQLLNAGTVTLRLKPNGSASASTVNVKLGSGNVYSLLVLDDGRELRGLLQRDATGFANPPRGGVETGAGGAAVPPNPFGLIGIGLAALLVLIAVARGMRRRASLTT